MHDDLVLIFEPQPEGGFTVTSPSFPELVTEGDDFADALENVRDALMAVTEIYLERGDALKLGTIRAAVRQLGLSWHDFNLA